MVKIVREEIEKMLPVYMFPANIFLLDIFPITRNGKIDIKALSDTQGTEELSTFEESDVPKSEIELALISIWKDLLSLDFVGLHDNFFNLGGDLIVTIQLVSRARSVGINFAVADVFTYQTVASLAKYLEQGSISSPETEAEQGDLADVAGLLPIQQWYFDKDPVAISHFNQSVLIGLNKAISVEVLKAAFELLIAHHDVLRFAYSKIDGKWQQKYIVKKQQEVVVKDLQNESKEVLEGLISHWSSVHQLSLNIQQGDLMSVLLIKTPHFETDNRLFIAIHHLVVDGVSWRILLNDLETIISQILGGKRADLGSKSSSYRQWYNTLNEYGQSKALLSQKGYWQQVVKNYKPLKVDTVYKGLVMLKDKQSFQIDLSQDDTRLLLQEVPKVYHTEINDVLLGALAKTL